MSKPIFKVHQGAQIGLDFANILIPDSAFNMFKYMYFYNGAGIGVADFNNDGNQDIFFSSNQAANSLYLGNGNLTFTNVTQAAGIPNDGGWSTGVSVADINHDGLMDIYICRVGRFETLRGKNQLLICTGIDDNNIPHYTDSAAAYGLDFSGFSTQAVFFDYDLDHDLDMFLMNHAVHHSGMFAERSKHLGTFSELSGDRMFRNDAGRFTDVTQSCGINSSEIGYGLGAVVTDVNLDGLPDLYIGNDFHENDYLYMNQGDGTFKEALQQRTRHTSQYSMGVDAGDINNDGWPEIISMDMLPGDPYILKRSLGEDAYDIFKMKIKYGYGHQYTRNNLQLNTGNGYFSETGLYSGIYATDWSWAPLWFDFNHDGLKDLFISNGIPKRLNDMDYVSFVSNSAYQDKIRNNAIGQRELAMIEKFPEIKLPNHFYLNTGNATFSDQRQHIAGDVPTYSNGSAYADFDNDGDLDVVTSNIGDNALIYENLTAKTTETAAVMIDVKGHGENPDAIGCRILIFCKNNQVLLAEKYPARGFQSSMHGPVHIGIGNHAIDSAWIIWPDNSYEQFTIPRDTNRMVLQWRPQLPKAPLDVLRKRQEPFRCNFRDITETTGIRYTHRENTFHEFDREPLLPHMLSTEGPALAVADINKDGLDDLFAGGARNQSGEIWMQQADGSFVKMQQPALQEDSTYEDTDAVWADVNRDGATDLLVASGGNEFFGKDMHLLPRLYLNDGKGNLKRKTDAFNNLYATWGSIAVHDINEDGAPDIFLGGRAIPFAYGTMPASYILLNDGKGNFSDATTVWAPQLQQPGFVTDAVWQDMNNDGRKDLLICMEWGNIQCFIHTGKTLKPVEITRLKGWWQSLLPADINGDGLTDIVAGNLGLNSRLKADKSHPVRMYAGDLDENGVTEQILTYYMQDREIPFANKDELMKQLPYLKKKYLYAGDFARASFFDLFSKKQLNQCTVWEANHFEHTLFINDGKGGYKPQRLPVPTQWTTLRAITAFRFSNGTKAYFTAGNFYENNIQMGRYDAGRGTVLIPQKNGALLAALPGETGIDGQVRAICPMRWGKQGITVLVLAKNNDRLQILLPE